MSNDQEIPVVKQPWRMIEQDLEEIPVEMIEVHKQPPPPTVNKVDSKEFAEAVLKELADCKQPWRTSKALAEKFGVDTVELDNFLRNQQFVCGRRSKEDGVFLYALLRRVETPPAKPDPMQRPLVTEEDHYALAGLHASLMNLEATLKKYAINIHSRNAEAFTQLMAGKDKLETGILMLATRLRADVKKLPQV